MTKLKDGFWKDKGILSDSYVLLAGGGHKAWGNASGNIPVSNGTVNTDLNADKLDGYHASGLFTDFTSQANSTTRIIIGGTQKDLKINADQLDGYHEGSFFRYRGAIDVNYVDLTTYTANATNYQNPNNGIYTVSRSGYSAGFIAFTGAGSASGLDIYFHYSRGEDFKFRRRIDGNRVSGDWETILTNVNWTSYIDGRYVKKVGDTMTGALTIKGVADTGQYSQGGFNKAYANIILQGDNTYGVSGIVFKSMKANDTNINSPFDVAFIQYHPYGVTASDYNTTPTEASTGELGRLVIGIGNDTGASVGEELWLQTAGANDLKHYVVNTGYTILDTGNVSPSIGISGNTIRVTVGGVNSSYITVPYATTSLNSTVWLRTWQREHDCNVDISSSSWHSQTRVFMYDGSTANRPGSGAGFMIMNAWDWGGGGSLIAQNFDDGDGGRLYTKVRQCGDSTTWSEWKKVAFITDKVDDSDKLDGYHFSDLEDRYVNVSGDWMNTDAQIYFKGANSSTSVYGSIGYRDSFNGKMHLGSDTYNTKALYVCSNGYNAANDCGGIAIDNDGVTAFGAGDTGSVFRVINEDSVSDGAQFLVTKNTGAAVKYNLSIGQNTVNTNYRLYVNAAATSSNHYTIARFNNTSTHGGIEINSGSSTTNPFICLVVNGTQKAEIGYAASSARIYLGNYNTDNTDLGWVNIYSDRGNVTIGDSEVLSTAWGNSNLIIGKDTEKAVIGQLASSTNGVVFGAHNQALSAWAPVNLSGSIIYFRNNESIRAKILDGCLSLFPAASSYREGIRIHSYGSWSDILLCGNDATGDSGTSANSWFIGNNNGNFYINLNGSSDAKASRLWGRSGGWNIGNTANTTYLLEVDGDIRSTGFRHNSVNSNDYVLLAGGSYKELIEVIDIRY